MELYARVKSYADSVRQAAISAFLARQEAENMPMVMGSGGSFSTPEDLTKPEVYNGAIASAIAETHGLFHEVDAITNFSETTHASAESALSVLEKKVAALALELNNTSDRYGIGAAYKSIKHVDFLENTNDNNLISAKTPLLSVDPTTGALTRPVALGISRMRSAAAQQMCRVEVEHILGQSAEPRHPLSEAIDGNNTTYWQEVILSDVPIRANPVTLPWLSKYYTYGAAARIRFDFESMVPISEIHIKELTDYPLEVLEICWATPPTRNFDPVYYQLFDGDFDNLIGGTAWHYQASEVGAQGLVSIQPNPSRETTALRIPTELGGELLSENALNCYRVVFDVNAPVRTCSLWQDTLVLENDSVYELEFYAQSNNGAGTLTANITGNTESANDVTIFTKTVTPTNNWSKYSFLIRTPYNLSNESVKLLFRFNDGYIMRITHVVVHKFMSSTVPFTTKSENGVLTIHLTKETGAPIVGRTLWITLAQKHYKVRTYTVKRSNLSTNELWARMLGNTSSVAVQPTSIWRSYSDRILASQASGLMHAAAKLGTLIKSMLANMIEVAKPSTETVAFTKYEYTIGAYEIDLRFKDHTPSGQWVSKPLKTTGELRQLTLLPKVSELERDAVHFWVIPRQEIPASADQATELTPYNGYSVFFSASGEKTGPLAINGVSPTVVKITPETKHERLVTSSRHGSIVLQSFPYFDADRAREILDTITQRGNDADQYATMNMCNSYDPNSELYVHTDATGSLITARGYTPIRVTLHLKNYKGQAVIAPPDTVGTPKFTRFSLVENEVLTRNSSQQTSNGEYIYSTAKNIAWIPGLGSRLSLYWRHNNTSAEDGRLDPADYTIVWDRQADTNSPVNLYGRALALSRSIRVKVPQLYDNSSYTLVAYYRTEEPHIVSASDMSGWLYVASGNAPELALQSFPVTRNMTDYMNPNPQYNLRPYDPDTYPVFEYYVSRDGALVFADNLFDPDNSLGYLILVDYSTLALQPRILITMDSPADGLSTSSSPSVQGYSLLINTRTV